MQMRYLTNSVMLLMGLVMGFVSPAKLNAADAAVTAQAYWNRGLEAYESRNYQEAIEAFEGIVALGEASAEVYYNLGNAYYKLGQHNDSSTRAFASGELGRAILNYHRALRLNPTMKDARYNLELAVDFTNDTDGIPQSFIATLWQGLRSTMTSNGWCISSIVMLALTLILVMLYLLSANILLRKIGFFVAIVTAVCFMLCTLLALSSKRVIAQDNRAVVVCSDTTPVHASPDSASKIIRQPSQGVTVRISRNHGDWTEVMFTDGEMGWIRNTAIEKV